MILAHYIDIYSLLYLPKMVLKCTLKMGKIKEVGNDLEEGDEQKMADEVAFLKEAFRILQPALEDSMNDTTNYSPTNVSGQKGRGSSLETSAQRSAYTSICTAGVTSQVLNISFKNKMLGKASAKKPIEQVLSASDTVIKFIYETERFLNKYSLLFYEGQKANWKNSCGDTIGVAGGLLFPILTLLLISYRSENGIIVIVESYGGKKRGSHLHWKFHETGPDDIAQTVKKLKEAEEKKITFIIKNTFKIIRERWPKHMTSISLHWGIGCDAIGGKLSNGDNSFLVCDAVRIPEIDHIRTQKTSDVFTNTALQVPQCLSAVTRGAANSDSDSNSDSDNGPIRHRLVSYLLCIIFQIYMIFSFLF
jgi:hypothetical protein